MSLLERIKALLGERASVDGDDAAVNAVQALINAVTKIRESIDARWAAEDAARQALPNDAGDEAVAIAFLERMDARVAEVEQARTALAGNVEQLTNQATEIEGKVTQLEQQLAQARQARDAERRERIVLLVNAAVSDGRVLQAEMEQWQTKLRETADFDAAVAELANAEPKLHVTPRSRDLGKRGADFRGRQEQFIALVNARMADKHEDYETAFAAVRQEHPELLGEDTARKGGAA